LYLNSEGSLLELQFSDTRFNNERESKRQRQRRKRVWIRMMRIGWIVGCCREP
jgi:hypothetical protein